VVMTAASEGAGRGCPVPAPHAAAQPSMIEDRGHAARESSSASLTARTAWYPQRAQQARPFCVLAYFLRADREITVGISMLGAASPRALNCSGFRNITEQPEQA